MKTLLSTIFLIILHLHNSMAQESIIHSNINEFESLLKSPEFKEKTAKVYSLNITNPKHVVHFPLASKEELPLNGILFPYMDEVLEFKNLKELRLICLYLTDLPEGLSSLKDLRTLQVEFSFSANANVAHIIKILSELESLKELDISGSRLTVKNRHLISKALIKKGVKMNDFIYVR